MPSLSICMIVKNEEDVIGRCLECVKDIADEIIIVDTGSTDKTKEIAKEYTDKLYDFPWINDFSAARNHSFSHATMDYIMWLDADDVIEEQNRKVIKDLMKSLNSDVDMIKMKYDVGFDENGKTTFSYFRERIFKRSMDYRWEGEIHEVICPRGNIIYSEIAICHKKMRPNEPQRNLKIFQQMLEQGKTLGPRQKFYYARELFYNAMYAQAVEQFQEFLGEGKGWIENNISACKDLAACYYQLGDDASALETLFKSLSYDQPRAEICCDIGNHFFSRNRYDIAIFWYETALNRKMDSQSGAFVLIDCYGYIPYIQLCVCYDKLGNHKKAYEMNEAAGEIKPKNEAYLFNKKYFDNLFERDKST